MTSVYVDAEYAHREPVKTSDKMAQWPYYTRLTVHLLTIIPVLQELNGYLQPAEISTLKF